MCHFIAIREFKMQLLSGHAQIVAKSLIFRPKWPWTLMNGLEKQEALSSMLRQALYAILETSVDSNWS